MSVEVWEGVIILKVIIILMLFKIMRLDAVIKGVSGDRRGKRFEDLV